MQENAVSIGVFVSLLITTIVAMGGWITAHYFSSVRDRKNKLIDLQIEHLLSIYRRLERSVGKEVTREIADDIETAIADLQLLGNKEQVKLVREYVDEWGGRSLSGINAGSILDSILKSIREDLGLDVIPGHVRHFRLYVASDAKDDLKNNPGDAASS